MSIKLPQIEGGIFTLVLPNNHGKIPRNNTAIYTHHHSEYLREQEPNGTPQHHDDEFCTDKLHSKVHIQLEMPFYNSLSIKNFHLTHKTWNIVLSKCWELGHFDTIYFNNYTLPCPQNLSPNNSILKKCHKSALLRP